MTPAKRAPALEEVGDRLSFAAATIKLTAKALESMYPYGSVLEGVAEVIDDAIDRLEAATAGAAHE